MTAVNTCVPIPLQQYIRFDSLTDEALREFAKANCGRGVYSKYTRDMLLALLHNRFGSGYTDAPEIDYYDDELALLRMQAD